MQSLLTIWMKIISLFQISLSEEGPSDTSDKRHTLLNLALTHPMLAEIALKELWKSMVSLKPIRGLVTHSYGPIFHDYLDYQDEYDSWFISYISNAEKEYIIFKMSHYLAHIQTLRIEFFDKEEYKLWQALSKFMPFPLCSNLRELYINFDALEMSEAVYLTPVLASSLRSISIYDPNYSDTGELAACFILDTLRFCNAEISSISYRGSTSNRILKRISSFSSLRSVSIPLCNKEGMGKTDIASFLTRNLTNLDINVNHFPDNILRQLGKGFETLAFLTSLSLHGSLSNIYKCICDLNPIASIYSFGLYRYPLSSFSERRVSALIPSLATIFPNMHSLHLENIGLNISMVTLNDLMSFRERPMQALDLINCFDTMQYARNIIEILKVWPTLQHLWFEGDDLYAEDLLPLISCSAPSLLDLTLPLKFPDVWNVSVVNEVVCPLQYLRIPPPIKIGFDFPEVFRRAHDLIELFPALRVISERTTSTWKFATIDFAIKDIDITKVKQMGKKMWKERVSSKVRQRHQWLQHPIQCRLLT